MKLIILVLVVFAALAAAAPTPAAAKIPIKCKEGEAMKRFCHPKETYNGPSFSRCRAWCEKAGEEAEKVDGEPTIATRSTHVPWELADPTYPTLEKSRRADTMTPDGVKSKKEDFLQINDFYRGQ